MLDSVFFQISALLGIVAVVSFLIHLLRQPLLIAYIITGILSGPIVFNLIDSSEDFYRAFSEFGVVLLLFVLGLSLNFTYLKKIGKVAIRTALAQVFFTSSIGLLILIFFKFSFVSALFLAIAITFSSTIIIIKLLTDKRELESVYGQYTVGLMLVQDVIAIVLLLFIPLLSGQESFVVTLGIWALKGIILFSVIYSLSKFILPWILGKVAKSAEFLFIFTIAWCFCIAGLAHWGGFSLEVGALMAGLSLGSTPYHFEISSRIKPLRDFFIMLFFIILGSQMNLGDLRQVIIPGLVLSIFVLIGNPLILYLLYRLQHFTRRNSFLASVTAAQVSEFGFVLLFVGRQLGAVTDRQIATYTVVALVTIFISSYVITYNKKLFQFVRPVLNLLGKDYAYNEEEEVEYFDAWVFGYHRMGWKIVETFKKRKLKTAVVDFNPEYIKKLQQRGISSYFGDVADVEFLDELNFEKAKIIVLTVPDPDDQITAISHIKKKNKKAYIVGTLNHARNLEDLYRAGADYVMMPHLLGGEWMSHKLLNEKWTKTTFHKLKRQQHDEMILRYDIAR
ncbi:hypothetical protein A2533_03140 [Candidatus Falkowbacteria bacterium RIFOXYD2_FULL_35_9]|uniref:Uncharacterized protein n=1 Tax=Candidatus Falkowbacteria bacterium RIFOXYC2_FULL_36_12 TaxID=1798002 RepID=A0A1F5SXC8_9BACT|nr:MAG: hypothetical protein A2478_00315 [Candidatus Falkowbacteria bacterium RIFOXYC2_FULL_36_12]OGF31461.1 MAG: hypothetical protein A2300_00115 [Candidatus Falkowbacteria bacterium RIFOXYB2_FULL_35_7]OGF46968.1 MAG: hypothetical protein A2533_03140 [Candidatus Falkowbacteria bacterium RIFOXYD2_FULL_35_9]